LKKLLIKKLPPRKPLLRKRQLKKLLQAKEAVAPLTW
jgi:hypothetical protein